MGKMMRFNMRFTATVIMTLAVVSAKINRWSKEESQAQGYGQINRFKEALLGEPSCSSDCQTCDQTIQRTWCFMKKGDHHCRVRGCQKPRFCSRKVRGKTCGLLDIKPFGDVKIRAICKACLDKHQADFTADTLKKVGIKKLVSSEWISKYLEEHQPVVSYLEDKQPVVSSKVPVPVWLPQYLKDNQRHSKSAPVKKKDARAMDDTRVKGYTPLRPFVEPETSGKSTHSPMSNPLGVLQEKANPRKQSIDDEVLNAKIPECGNFSFVSPTSAHVPTRKMKRSRSKRKNRKTNNKGVSNSAKILLGLGTLCAVTSGTTVPIDTHTEPAKIVQKVHKKKNSRYKRRGKSSTVPKKVRVPVRKPRYGKRGRIFQPKRQGRRY